MAAEPPAPPPTTDIEPFAGSRDDVTERLRLLREAGPVHRLAGGDLVVTNDAGVRECLQHVTSFVGTVGDTGELGPDDTLLSGMPEPRHGQVRKVFNAALAYHQSSKAEPFVRELVARLMQETLDASARAADGVVDVMRYYARPLPSAVIAHILGIGSEHHELFGRWSDEVLERQGSDGASSRPLLDLHQEFAAFVTEQVERRLAAVDPPDDVLTRLLYTEIDGERLSARAVCTQVMFLVVAGNETTRNLIGNALRRIAEHDGLLERLRREPELIPALIEETLRLDAPVQLTARTCSADITIDGVAIERGDRLTLSIASANRDADHHVDPDEMRLDRARPRDHLGFGSGPHICPGAYLARMETEHAIATFVGNVAAVSFPDDHVDDPNPVYWAHGPRTLRLRLVPDETAAASTASTSTE